ncbi:hypothetical protein F0U44_08195 [Nocardioides humilatus]|uniref:Uncharacterized protein n=1 Tax=Nocardioides humilatus TaxID=2607660 RepID=A0A5B1LDV8_9ACTN|nr:hypothetical protein [Nocardioides humilatus]KAA1418484.1 hypothetical protein F0U44_08195 [Nocardioides humilatus]
MRGASSFTWISESDGHGQSDEVDATWQFFVGPDGHGTTDEVTGEVDFYSWASGSPCTGLRQTADRSSRTYISPVDLEARRIGTGGLGQPAIQENDPRCDPIFGTGPIPDFQAGAVGGAAYFDSVATERSEEYFDADTSRFDYQIEATLDELCQELFDGCDFQEPNYSETRTGGYELRVRLTNECDYDADGIPDTVDATPTIVTPLDDQARVTPGPNLADDGTGCSSLDQLCATADYTTLDTFEVGPPDVDPPSYEFSLDTTWCKNSTGDVLVLDSVAAGVTPATTLAAEFLAQAIRFFLTPHERWTEPDVKVEGDTVTARASVQMCMGIPIIGKIKYVTKVPRGFRIVAGLLRKIDGKKLEKIVRPMAKAIDSAADAIAFAIKHGGRLAKRAARAAISGIHKLIAALPQGPQKDVTLAIVGVLAQWQTSSDWSRGHVKGWTLNDGALLIPGNDPLERLLSDELVCFDDWKPKIKQTFTTDLLHGEFVDAKDDNRWLVARRQW